MKKTGTLIFGGDVNLGRHLNVMTKEIGPEKVLGTLGVIKQSDLAIVNLECVVASCGDYADKKDEIVPFYFRGRQENIDILTDAHIDMVSLANNHSGDYGPDAFSEMLGLLKQAGITSVGGGMNETEAAEPVIRSVGGVVVAFIGIDFTTPFYAAKENIPGHYFLPHDKIDEWKDDITKKIQELKKKSDLVIPVVHWGPNFLTEPCTEVKKLARTLIVAGADAILGASAHLLHGVEVIDGKPIIYDAGNFLFDFRPEDKVSGLFQLFLSQDGVEEIRLIPTKAAYCYTTYANLEEGKKTLSVFKERCEKLRTPVNIDDGPARIKLKPTPKEKSAPITSIEHERRKFSKIAPLTQVPPYCVVDTVPSDAQIPEKKFGPLKLLGLKFQETHLKTRAPNILETYWMLSEEKVEENFMIIERLLLRQNNKESMWDADHDACDYLWPISRWEKGIIYYDRFLMRPPLEGKFIAGIYDLVLGIANIRTNEQYIEKLDVAISVDEG